MPFHYGLGSVEDVEAVLRASASDGLYAIVNETIDVGDGGVSGVSLGGVLEFAPDATPRVVESGETCNLAVDLGRAILSRVYQIELPIPSQAGVRFEFSVHPNRVGHRSEHMLIWEREEVPPQALEASGTWPNPFSRLIGDKTFGLLVADALGLSVPRATVIGRRVAPFAFGEPTGSAEWWTRTCPDEAEPGMFTTTARWIDPFALLEREDPLGRISSVLAQEGVQSQFSGAAAAGDDQDWVIEGIGGFGDDFMLGRAAPVSLPANVTSAVGRLLNEVVRGLGPARIEWAFDGDRVWVLQLHRGGSPTGAGLLSAGDSDVWLEYDPADGLEGLRELTMKASAAGAGVEVIRPVGVTSHVGDILRKAGVPGRLRPSV